MLKENLIFSGDANPTNTTTNSTTKSPPIPISKPITITLPLPQSPSLMLPNSPLMLAVRDVEGAIKRLSCHGSPSTTNLPSPRTTSPPTTKPIPKHDTFSAKILLELKNTSSSTPSSPLTTNQPLSPSSIIDLIGSNTSNSNNNSGENINNTLSPPPPPSQQPRQQGGFASPSWGLPTSIPTTPTMTTTTNTTTATMITPDSPPVQCVFKECLLCKRGSPFAINQSPTWACIMKIVFYCLQIEMPHKAFLNLKTDVYGFMTAHWNLLCLDKKRSDNWHKQIQDMLSHSKNLFESGIDTYKQNGYWRMRQISDPWDEIKAKKIITKRKRSYSENDSSNVNKGDHNSTTTTTTTTLSTQHYNQRDILHSPKNSNGNGNSGNNSITSSSSTSLPVIDVQSSMKKLTSVALEEEINDSLNSSGSCAGNESFNMTGSSGGNQQDVLSSPISSPINNGDNQLPQPMDGINSSSNSSSLNNSNSNVMLSPSPTSSMNNSLNNSSNNNNIMHHSSIDKQIHENFNQLSTQLKIMKENSSLSSNSLSTSPSNNGNGVGKTRQTGQRKRAHTESNISGIPPLPLIPMISGFLSGGNGVNQQNTLLDNNILSPISPRTLPINNHINNSVISSPRGSYKSTSTAAAALLLNQQLQQPQPTPQQQSQPPIIILSSTSEVSSSNSSNTNTPPLSSIDNINDDMDVLSASSLTTTTNSNNSSSNNSNTTTTVDQLKDQLRQVTENLKNIKDNSLTADREFISLMINKEIERISLILQPSSSSSSSSTTTPTTASNKSTEDNERSVPSLTGLQAISEIVFMSK